MHLAHPLNTSPPTRQPLCRPQRQGLAGRLAGSRGVWVEGFPAAELSRLSPGQEDKYKSPPAQQQCGHSSAAAAGGTGGTRGAALSAQRALRPGTAREKARVPSSSLSPALLHSTGPLAVLLADCCSWFTWSHCLGPSGSPVSPKACWPGATQGHRRLQHISPDMDGAGPPSAPSSEPPFVYLSSRSSPVGRGGSLTGGGKGPSRSQMHSHVGSVRSAWRRTYVWALGPVFACLRLGNAELSMHRRDPVHRIEQ